MKFKASIMAGIGTPPDDGRCRFNCRNEKDAFVVGYELGFYGVTDAEEAYREWKRQQKKEG